MGDSPDPLRTVVNHDALLQGVQDHLPKGGMVIDIQPIIPAETDLHGTGEGHGLDPVPLQCLSGEHMDILCVPGSLPVMLPGPVGIQPKTPVPVQLPPLGLRVRDGKAYSFIASVDRDGAFTSGGSTNNGGGILVRPCITISISEGLNYIVIEKTEATSS